MKFRHLVLTVLALLVSTAAARAYVLFGPKWAIAEIPYYVNPANGDSIPDATVLADIQAAGAAWTTQSNAAVSLYYMGTTNGATAAVNGKNEVFFRNASKDAAAATTYWWSENNRLIEADIVIWDATYVFAGNNSSCSGAVLVQDVMTHEFGHALGLAHSSVSAATMYPVINRCSTAMRSLDPDDIAGIEALYPASGANAAPSVTIATPSSGASFSENVAISFSGSATDSEDGNLASNLVWLSSRDGQIGTGPGFQRSLSVGTHTITARVTDSKGAVSEAKRSVTIASGAPIPDGFLLWASGYKVKGAQRVDLSWTGSAATSIDVYRGGAKLATTPNDGFFTDLINRKGSGTYEYFVCAAGTSTCSTRVTVVF